MISSILVVDLVLGDNDPGAGEISWAACTVYLEGVEKSIAAGDTDKMYVTWTVGATSFVGTDSFAPAPDIFLIATNNEGIADVAWNKLADQGVQRSNVGFPLLEGVQPQPIAVAVRDLLTTGTTAVFSDTSQAGGVLNIQIEVATPPDDPVTVVIHIQIDGATAQDVPVYTAALTFDPKHKCIAVERLGDGSNIGDYVMMKPDLGYTTSCLVSVEVTNAANAAGSLTVRAYRAHVV